MSKYTVMAIEAVVSVGSTFVLAQYSTDRLALTSTSLVVQGAVLGAFLTGAKVEPETEGTTQVVRRIDAFEAGSGQPQLLYGDYRVARVATQREADGTDHLEVFLHGSDPKQIPCNIYDPLLQQLFMAAFQQPYSGPGGFPIQVSFDKDNLVGVRLGER